MATTLFDIRVRLLECAGCGAPLEAAVAGGTARCGYCGATNRIAKRSRDTVQKPPPSMAEEVARRSRLAAQLATPVTGHVYDMARPPMGYEALVGAPEGLRQAYLSMKAAGAPPTASDQHRLAWTVLRLADAYGAGGQRRELRAILETTLDMLPDAGHRHLLRCRLATEALRDGDPTAAEGWLGECDARQEVLQLDSAFRAAQARLHAARGELPAVLELLGVARADVPIHPENRSEVSALRLHALDGIGEVQRADALLAQMDARARLDVLALARAEGLAIGVVIRARSAELARLPGTWLGALIGPLGVWPILAVVLFVPVTIVRCGFNADPLLGVHGHSLCPRYCEGCHGPLRTITRWSCSGGECSTNGPQYFCPAPENGIDRMDDDVLEANVYRLTYWELSYAPAAATLLLLLAMTLPLVLFLILRNRFVGGRRRRAIADDIAALAAHYRQRAPPPPSSGSKAAAVLIALTVDAIFIAALIGVVWLEVG